MSFRNLKLTIQYDGTHYAGWQIQPNKKTIQGLVQDVLRRVTQEKKGNLIGASRTDAGVHALGQVAHFRTRSRIPSDKLLIALNGLLPADISVSDVGEAEPAFHAQKAKRKVYRYWIWNERVRSALLKDRAWHVWTPLNLSKMRKAAHFLEGRHDFSAFRARLSGTKTSERIIYEIEVRKGSPLQITIAGNGFLKYMVRNIVGTLVDVGKGRLEPEDVKAILHSKDRKKAGATAPASGLYLVSITY